MVRESSETSLIDWAGQRCLVVAPHVDDEVLSGATLRKITDAGGRVGVAALSPAIESIPEGFDAGETWRELDRSCDRLGISVAWRGSWPVRRFHIVRQDILERLVSLRRDWHPTVVLCPSSTDMHQDHEVIHRESLRAFRNCALLLGWESPNNERGTFAARIFVEVESEHVDAKVAAWKEYATQQHRASYSERVIRGLAAVRGGQCRSATGLAEAFELVSLLT